MPFSIALVPFVLFVVFVVFRGYNLTRNYIAARKFGLPIIVLPVSFEDVWWIPIRPLFSWVERLPFGLGSWYVYTEMGWPTVDGNRTSVRLGENYIVCSPYSNQIVTSYPPGVDRIYRGQKNWRQLESQAKLFTLYGENLLTTNGSDWQRHRKITAPAFNENCMRQVWEEASKRAAALNLMEESDQTWGETRSTFDVLTMRVLAMIALGQDNAMLTSIPPGHRESLMQCLGVILRHVTLTIVFNINNAPEFLLPGVLRRLKRSVAEFRLYMEESVFRQMSLRKENQPQSRAGGLLEAILRANEAEKQMQEKSTRQRSYLTDSELYGNLYIFNIAGFETTSASMSYALSFAAATPEIQDWLVEEIDAHYTNSSDRDYATTYPKLVRCLAWMYETLRFASPGPLIVRTNPTAQNLPIMTPNGESSITVDPETIVGTNFYAGHLSPRWGPDAATFNPKRFISTSASGEETFAVPEGVLYMPWGFGPRVCPGKKFSQVEFVAVLAHVLSEYRVEVLTRDGESEAAARDRMMDALGEKYFNISAHPRRPGNVGVRYVRRSTN